MPGPTYLEASNRRTLGDVWSGSQTVGHLRLSQALALELKHLGTWASDHEGWHNLDSEFLSEMRTMGSGGLSALPAQAQSLWLDGGCGCGWKWRTPPISAGQSHTHGSAT
jgi:hypothetical protein